MIERAAAGDGNAFDKFVLRHQAVAPELSPAAMKSRLHRARLRCAAAIKESADGT